MLEEGMSMREICRLEGMPALTTVKTWIKADEELAARIREARETGFEAFAEHGVQIAFAPALANPTDPQAARLAFDAVRWKLGKLSHAFGDRPLVEATVNVAGDDAIAALRGVLDRAAAAIASSGDSTHQVALPSSPGPDHAAG